MLFLLYVVYENKKILHELNDVVYILYTAKEFSSDMQPDRQAEGVDGMKAELAQKTNDVDHP